MKYDTVSIGVAADGFYFTFENKDDPDNQEQFFVSQALIRSCRRSSKHV